MKVLIVLVFVCYLTWAYAKCEPGTDCDSFCCPYSEATCCSNRGCCPNGYMCDEAEEQCVSVTETAAKMLYETAAN
ncbi:hypothetical protein L596_010326 [Steinernema carpocapsae]|uniref:Granulins domain-containing protein n=1 Tax=Steinernema carpocapsae TaxID=34508 RepID=A0A4U5PIQ7_STECR|nr:hypothetical protein L596_010326 [Steinernema carpocapsae]